MAAGNNVITLHATDLAGNVTLTNLTYVFSTSGDFTPPATTLYWPQAGTAISGSNFICRGRLDDPTASITARIVDATGATNTVAGWVERGGLFWIDGLPLSAGTNQLTLTATDAAGNSNTSSLAVVQSAMALTIGDFSAQDLNQGTIALSGTIGSTAYAVWVNGVRGTNNGDGTWSVPAAPLNWGGRVILEAVAIPTSDNGGNGTGGGGGAPTNENMRNPASPYAVAMVAVANQPFRAPYVQSYTNLLVSINHVEPDLLANFNDVLTSTNMLTWTDGQGGAQTLVQTLGPRADNAVVTTETTWPQSRWPALVNGTYTTGSSAGGDSSGVADPPQVVLEHQAYRLSQWVPPPVTLQIWNEREQHDQAVIKMQTGGRAAPGGQSLYCISGSRRASCTTSRGPG